jgi:hypothetical protein
MGNKTTKQNSTEENGPAVPENQTPASNIPPYNPDTPVPTLTDKQRVMLAETWKQLESNIAKVGVITFIR